MESHHLIEAKRYTSFTTTFSVEAERQFIGNLGNAPFSSSLLVAERTGDGLVVGFQGMSLFPSAASTAAHVGVMGTFVHLDFHRRGIATHLFGAMWPAARAEGYEKVFTYVRADNEAGIATYLSQGFRVVGTAERHLKIDGAYIDEAVIEKLL